MIEPNIRDFARGKNFGTISFHLSSGAIGTHVMWVDADDEHMLINTDVNRTKYRALQKDPNVTVVVFDAANPYTYAEVRGRVTGEVRGPDAAEHIHELSRRYNGSDYPTPVDRVILQITPERQRSQGL